MAPTLPPIIKQVAVQIDPFDDWETAYSRNDEPITDKSRNAKLWSEANPTTPSYSLHLSSQSTSTSRLPPSTALLPGTLGNTMTILKRPSSAASDNIRSRSTSEDIKKERTLVEREKDYEEARRRIYGIESTGENSKKQGSKSLESSLEKLSLSEVNLGKVSNGNKRGGRGRGKINGEEKVKVPGLGRGTVEVRAPKGPSNNEGGGFGKK